jgi:site-specific recombinase XerD
MTDEFSLSPVSGDLSPVTMRIDENPSAIYLAGLKESGRRSMRQVLNLVAGLLTGNADALSCPWASLRFQHVSAVRSQIESRYKPATVNKTLAALRGVLRAAWQAGQMTAEDYQKAVSVKSVKNTTLPAGRELTSGELASLMAACEHDRTPAGTRDAAIIAAMYAAGLRREEVITLDLEDYDSQTGQMIIRGKGNKERTAYLPTGGAQALGDWLKVRGAETGPLFYCVNKGGRLISNRMTSQAIYNLLDKRARQAGVKDFSPHDMRRTFVSDLLDSGADIVTVSKMAGHANVQTTARYDRRPEEAKRKAASLLHVPYRGRG